MELTFSLQTIKENATRFWKLIPPHTVVAFHGEMGAGKTTFIQALCEVKNVKDQVSSPTFSIINEYRFEENGHFYSLFHLDLYRLQSIEEAVQAGVEDCLNSGSICFVEWPEKAGVLLPENTLHVYISLSDSYNRKLLIVDK